MTTSDVLQRKIQSVEDLQSIVKTMKTLAAASIHQYESAVAALAEHTRVIELALQILMLQSDKAMVLQSGSSSSGAAAPPIIAPPPTIPHRLGIVAFGSDQGMCGQFNETLADFIAARLHRQGVSQAAIVAVGSRLADRLAAIDQPIERCLPVPSAVNGVTPLVWTLVLQLEAWQTTGQVDHIWAIYNRPGSTTAPHPVLRQLFPLSTLYLQQLAQRPWPSRCRPQSLTDSRALFSAVFQQHFFIGLYRACAESLASENASRLASMQAAEKNIEERLFGLKAAFQQQRQDSITEELLDIIAGFEALNLSIE